MFLFKDHSSPVDYSCLRHGCSKLVGKVLASVFSMLSVALSVVGGLYYVFMKNYLLYETLLPNVSQEITSAISKYKASFKTSLDTDANDFAVYRINQAIDFDVNPCDDFYKYACGRWLVDTDLAEGQPAMNWFIDLTAETLLALKGLLEQPVQESDLTSIKKTKLFYRACIDIDSINQRGTSPLKEFLIHELGGWPLTYTEWNETNFDFVATLAKINLLTSFPIVKFYVGFDLKDNTKRSLTIDQPSFGIPGRNYYLANRNDTIVMAYQDLITGVATVLGLANTNTSAQDIKAVVDFEIQLAQISETKESKHESINTFNPMTLEDVQGNYSKIFNWTRYVQTIMSTAEVNITNKEIVMNHAPLYFRKLTDVISNTPNKTIANYIIWAFVYQLIKQGVVGIIFEDHLVKFNQALYGTKSDNNLFIKCVTTTTSALNLPVGRMYVESHFDPVAKFIAREMIAELKNAFSELLLESDWLDEKTKQYAARKKNYIVSKIGYPYYIYNDTYMDLMYSELQVETTFFENVLSALRFHYVRLLCQLIKANKKDEWIQGASETDAFYIINSNQMVIPAGILQPPFFHKLFAKSMNYGGIGMLIGHEMIHGFDDTGRHYDNAGNLYNWWSPEAQQKFQSKAQCMIDQYGNFTLEPSKIRADGVRTIGENIADNGGLRQAFRAYRNWVNSQGHEEKDLPGLNFTHNQIFFISFAQIWCSKETDAAAQNHINTQSHSLGEFRVNGAVQNSKDFSEAFNCPVESKMNPSKKCLVW